MGIDVVACFILQESFLRHRHIHVFWCEAQENASDADVQDEEEAVELNIF